MSYMTVGADEPRVHRKEQDAQINKAAVDKAKADAAALAKKTAALAALAKKATSASAASSTTNVQEGTGKIFIVVGALAAAGAGYWFWKKRKS